MSSPERACLRGEIAIANARRSSFGQDTSRLRRNLAICRRTRAEYPPSKSDKELGSEAVSNWSRRYPLVGLRLSDSSRSLEMHLSAIVAGGGQLGRRAGLRLTKLREAVVRRDAMLTLKTTVSCPPIPPDVAVGKFVSSLRSSAHGSVFSLTGRRGNKEAIEIGKFPGLSSCAVIMHR